MSLTLAIDASRNRSGGAVAHMIGLIGAAEPERFGFSSVHVWSYDKLLQALPERPWLVRHNPPQLEQGLMRQLHWQRWKFPREIRQVGCDILLNTDAGTIGRFRPAVTMSRDMLSYEPGEITRYGWTKARMRLWLLRHIQNRSLRHADGAVFLTQYAAEVIQQSCGTLPQTAIIPHGVREDFRGIGSLGNWSLSANKLIRCLYISNTAPYKHQWHVVQAIKNLRELGYPVCLTLVGGGGGSSQQRLETTINQFDSSRSFITQMPFVPHSELGRTLKEADIFVFASSCENMPNTLIEGMAAGLPIACSNRGPMPEVLHDGGCYFNPEDADSIAKAIQQLIDDPRKRQEFAIRSKSYATVFSWKRCADETFCYLAEIYRTRYT